MFTFLHISSHQLLSSGNGAFYIYDPSDVLKSCTCKSMRFIGNDDSGWDMKFKNFCDDNKSEPVTGNGD